MRRVAAGSSKRVVWMVAAAVFINYIDRGNLSTAAPLLKTQLHLSASQLGILLSAFYYPYVISQAPAGWVAERYGAQRTLLAGFALWSIATILTGFAGSFAMLLLLRLLLGVGESVAFPCASKLLAVSVEKRKLGSANGLMSFGYMVGPAVGTLAGGLLMAKYGWRQMFWVLGILCAVWLLPWSRTKVPTHPVEHASDSWDPPFKEILRQRGLWGTVLGLFCANYGYFFIISYLVKARGNSIADMAWIASWAYLISAVCALVMGWLADLWIRAGRSANTIYKGLMAIYHGGGALCMLSLVFAPATDADPTLFAYFLLAGISAPGIYAIPQIVAGPAAAGRWVGVQNGVGATAGMVAPAVTGVLLQQTGHFSAAFALTAVVTLLGLIGWVYVLPKVEPIEWTRTCGREK